MPITITKFCIKQSIENYMWVYLSKIICETELGEHPNEYINPHMTINAFQIKLFAIFVLQ